MAQAQSAYDPIQEGRRADARLRLHLPARLVLLNRSAPCILENISLTGARLVIEKPPKVGEFGEVHGEALCEFFEVVWASGRNVGIAFDEPLRRETLFHLREFNDSFPELQKREMKQLARAWVTGEQR